MKDPHDQNKTLDLFKQYEAPTENNKPFQRFHIKRNGKKTTVSIETLNAEFLAFSLGEVPHTKESKKKIIEWIGQRIQKSVSYDKDAPSLFSQWLKREIMFQIVNKDLMKKRDDWMMYLFENKKTL